MPSRWIAILLAAGVLMACPAAFGQTSVSSGATTSPAGIPHPAASGRAPGAADGGATAAPQTRAELTPEQGRIGDRFQLVVTAEAPGAGAAEDSEAIAPGTKLGPFRILEADRSRPGELVLTLTPETTGDLEVPAFVVAFQAASESPQSVGGRSESFHVAPIHVLIASVLKDADTSLADLKPPAELPVAWPWRMILLVLVGILAAAIFLLLLRRFLKRPRRAVGQPEQRLEPGETADAWARAALENLLAKGHYPAGRIREFHIELADLVRTYLELRFRIPALERTTEEVTDEIRRALLPEGVATQTHEALARCDGVKFAKERPDPAEADATVEIVRRIIAMTTPAAGPVVAPISPAEAAESAA